MSHHIDPVGLFVLVAAGVAYLVDRLGGDRSSEDVDVELEELRSSYVAGEISLATYEDRVETILDPGVRRLRARVERVDGVGDDLSLRIAREFDSIDELTTANQAALEDVHGIGPSTAEAIQQELGDS